MSNCPCDAFVFPPTRDIAAGLPGDALRAARVLGAFPEWRRAVLDAIGRAPALDDWRAREQYDLGLMLVEMGAVVFDGVAFYNALINAEAYLRTAQFTGAKRRLVEVLGYRPRPAMSARAFLAAQADGVRVVHVPAGAAFRSGGFNAEVDGSLKPQDPQVFELEQAAKIDPRVNHFTVAVVEETAVPTKIGSVLAKPGSVRVQAGQSIVLEFGSFLLTARVSAVRTERLRSKKPAVRISFKEELSIPKKPDSSSYTWAELRMFVPGATVGLWNLGEAQ